MISTAARPAPDRVEFALPTDSRLGGFTIFPPSSLSLRLMVSANRHRPSSVRRPAFVRAPAVRHVSIRDARAPLTLRRVGSLVAHARTFVPRTLRRPLAPAVVVSQLARSKRPRSSATGGFAFLFPTHPLPSSRTASPDRREQDSNPGHRTFVRRRALSPQGSPLRPAAPLRRVRNGRADGALRSAHSLPRRPWRATLG
jgi:hypothetical protein